MRVYSDRLINQEDKLLFIETIKSTIGEVSANYIDFKKVDPEALIFNNFVEFNPNDP